MRQIILASKSNARRLLLTSLGFDFEVVPSEIDEKKIRDRDLSVRAEKIARKKAEKIASEHDAVIISADTFSESDGKVLEKPRDINEAKEMLNFLSGKNATNFTGFCYLDKEKGIDYSTTVKTPYTFRKLYKTEIDSYVKKFPVTQWAAGFALIDPYINTFIAKVNGSLTALSYGLPSEILIPLLQKSGFEPNIK